MKQLIILSKICIYLTWWPNWLHGNPKTTSLSPNFWTSSFIWGKSRVVVSHRDAVFSTKI